MVLNSLNWHQKAPGKGGHHLGLIWPYNASSFDSGLPQKRDPPHTTRGPPVIGIAMPSKGSLKVEVILTVCDQKEKSQTLGVSKARNFDLQVGILRF